MPYNPECPIVWKIWYYAHEHTIQTWAVYFSLYGLLIYLTISPFLESRPLSIPMKVIPDLAAEESSLTSEERMKALIAHAWDAVKRLTLQVPLNTLERMITHQKTCLSCKLYL